MRSKGWGSVGGLMTVTARYEDGVFKPLQDVRISEGTAAEVRIPSVGGRLKNRARSVADFTFFGMWKDRTDIGDSVEYVSNLGAVFEADNIFMPYRIHRDLSKRPEPPIATLVLISLRCIFDVHHL